MCTAVWNSPNHRITHFLKMGLDNRVSCPACHGLDQEWGPRESSALLTVRRCHNCRFHYCYACSKVNVDALDHRRSCPGVLLDHDYDVPDGEKDNLPPQENFVRFVNSPTQLRNRSLSQAEIQTTLFGSIQARAKQFFPPVHPNRAQH